MATRLGSIPRLLIAAAAMLTLCLSCSSSHAASDSPGTDESLYNERGLHMKRVFEDNFVSIAASTKITKEDAAKLAADVRAAYDFDTQQNLWSDMSKLKDAIKVRVRPDLPGGVLAKSVFPNILALNSEYVGTPIMQSALARELSMLQDGRQLAGLHAPAWLTEGRACLNAVNYRMKLGLPITARDSESIQLLQDPSCAAVLSDERSSEHSGPTLRSVETVSAFFLEFLRTKYGGAGVADTMGRSSRIIEILAQREPFVQSFDRAFGFPAYDATSKFSKYLTYTKGHPEVCFKGTVFEKLLPSVNKKP